MAFTTVADIEATLGSTLTAAEQTQAGVLIPIVESTIREAAGSNITQTTVTVNLEGHHETQLHVPLQPLTGVSAVTIDGETVTNYTRVGQSLWRTSGWTVGHLWRPANVEVTLTYGHATVPGAVRLLTEHLVLAAIAQTSDGSLSPPQSVSAETIGDYSVTYRDGNPEHVLELPDTTRRWLRRTYGPTTVSMRSR